MKPLLLTWWLLAGADAVTTRHIVMTGGREVMLPSQHPDVLTGLIAGQAYMGSKLLGPKHTKTTVGIAIGLMVVRGVAVSYNLRRIQEHNGR